MLLCQLAKNIKISGTLALSIVFNIEGDKSMADPLKRSDKEISELYARHVKTVYRVCYAYMKNTADTEDAAQDTFLRLIRKGPAFESEAHEKAWLIRTAGNVCKDQLKSWRRGQEELSENYPQQEPFALDGVMEAVLALPDKYKTVVYMYYYEGFDSAEIARHLQKPNSTIRNYLSEARTLLRNKLGGSFE
jgi:RNA polymerase sigma-70 factor (ECF subfamily)